MKKIDLGFDNSIDPTGSWEGIGLNPQLPLIQADYYGTVQRDDNSYIIIKVPEDANEHLHKGDFIVRPAIADLYKDGSGIIFLDQEETIESQLLEKCLNSPEIKAMIKEDDIISRYCNGFYPPDKSFIFLTMDNKFMATSIKHEVFERKNEALKSCHNSFSKLQEELLTYENKHTK